MWRLWSVLAAPSSQRGADWLYSSELGDEFQAWCANGTSLAGSAVEKYQELHALAGSGLGETQSALDLVQQEMAALDAAGRPQSIDPSAGVLAAMQAMELAFTPEARELENQRIQLRTLLSAYQADYSDGEVLARNGGTLLGQLTKAGRQEKNLEGEVELALQAAAPPALLRKGQAVRRAAAKSTHTSVAAELAARADEAKQGLDAHESALDRALDKKGGGGSPPPPPAGPTGVARSVWDDAATSTAVVAAGYPGRGGSELNTKWDHNCLDYNYNDKNVYMHSCHGGSNQKWFLMDGTGNTNTGEGELHTAYDGNCLDYNYNNGNIYMHGCHGGANQQWYFDASGQLRSRQDNKCMDYNQGNGNVYMHDCHGGANQHWFFSSMRALDTSSPLNVLQSLLSKLDQRKTECDHHLAQREAIAKQAAAASQDQTARTAEALERMQDTTAVLKEYRAFSEALADSRAEGKKLFDRERILYATEVEHLTHQVEDPLAASQSTAMKAVDTAHGFWMEWHKGVDDGFSSLLSYLETRHGQLENQLANQEYLRPDKSPHVMYAKTGPPVGLHCPDAAEYADRRRKIEEAIKALTDATANLPR